MRGTSGALPGALVISLDFELRWGVRDTCPPGGVYERNLLGARDAIPLTLSLFESYGVSATWATVGLLFARTRDELISLRPKVLPQYTDPSLSPYGEATGADEAEDPLHLAPSLIERIAATPGQEVGTHTFSHYYCLEPGQTFDSFRADLKAAVAMASRSRMILRSVVFPRNQHNPAYDPILLEAGIACYRGNPRAWMWRAGGVAEARSLGRRSARLLDAHVDLTDPTYAWDSIPQAGGLSDVRASIFLRPVQRRFKLLSRLRRARIVDALRRAAAHGRLLHLWWHPHNFGAETEENLANLALILDEYARLRDSYGMLSLNMLNVHELATEKSGGRATGPDASGSAGNSSAIQIASDLA